VREVLDFGTIVQPRLNLSAAVTDRITFFANAGRSFQHPFGADTFAVGSTTARDVSHNLGLESGMQWTLGDGVELRVSFWEQNATDEFVVVDGTGQNVGETERRGFDTAVNWRAGERVYLWANVTTIDAEITLPDQSQAAFVGNELRSIADYTASLGVSVAINPSWVARVHVDSQGDYFVNEANLGGEFGDYTLVNASFDYETPWGNVSLQLQNLLDEYYEYVFDLGAAGTDIIHSPGDGLNASVSVGIKF
jgi:iron complex outermembrane recepter protein